MIERINKTIKKRLNKYNLTQSVQAAFICNQADIIGKSYQFKSVSYKNGLLTISVENNMIAQEARFKEKEIIKQINEKVKNLKIRKFIYRVDNNDFII